MARGLNRVFLIGALATRPDMRYTPAGLAILDLTLAGQALGSGYTSVAESLKPFSAVLTVVLGFALLTGVCWVGLRLLRARNRADRGD